MSLLLSRIHVTLDMPFRHPENLCNFPTNEAIADNANDLTLPPVKEMFNIPALIFPHVFFLNPLG